MEKNYISIGNAGEYFVAGELERHGFTAAVPMSNTKDFDILAINRKTHEQFAIQVKTASGKVKQWRLTSKNEELKGDNIIYFFVALNEMDTPEYHIVPSRTVARLVKKNHSDWLNTPGKNGQQHQENDIRSFYDKDDTYLNNWSCLNYKG